jgi:hypothetical protein
LVKLQIQLGRTLGIAVPLAALSIADKVIE